MNEFWLSLFLLLPLVAMAQIKLGGGRCCCGFAYCNGQGGGCSFCDNSDSPETWKIVITGIANGSCSSCTTYNATYLVLMSSCCTDSATFSQLIGSTPCASGSCGTGLRVRVVTGATLSAEFEGGFVTPSIWDITASPLDCVSQQNLSLTQNGTCHTGGACDLSGSSATAEPGSGGV